MHATNTSSTKSPIVWQARLQPSRLFAALYWFCIASSLLALWQCPVHWSVRIILVAVTFGFAIRIFIPTRHHRQLALREDATWLLVDENQRHYSGYIASGSYRSMALIVVAIKPDKGFTAHAIIWRDSVSASDFSALHMRLALTPAHELH